MKKYLRRGGPHLAALLLFTAFGTVSTRADAIFVGPNLVQPAGIGTVPTILSLTSPGSTTTEDAFVNWNGTSDVTGGDTAALGNNETRTLASLGVTSASDLRVYFNINEPNSPGAGNVILTDLEFRFFTPGGTQFFTAAYTGPDLNLLEIGPGIGTSDYEFRLDDTQASALQANPLFSTSVRLGLRARIEEATGGFETFFAGSAASPPAAIPEPATMLLLGTGLVGLGAAVKKRRQAKG